MSNCPTVYLWTWSPTWFTLKAWLNHQKRVQFRPSCARVTLPRAAEVGVPGVAPDDEMKERAMMAGNLALFHAANMMTMEEFSTLIHWFMKVISASKLTIFRLVKPCQAHFCLRFSCFPYVSRSPVLVFLSLNSPRSLRMSGSKAARRSFLLKRVADPKIKTSELQRPSRWQRWMDGWGPGSIFLVKKNGQKPSIWWIINPWMVELLTRDGWWIIHQWIISTNPRKIGHWLIIHQKHIYIVW